MEPLNAGPARAATLPEIKVCGLTRLEDAQHAESMGAAYLGGIRAGGPRLLSADAWRAVLGPPRQGVERVAVIGRVSVESLLEDMRALDADIAQWHGDPTPHEAAMVHATGVRLWSVVRIAGNRLPPLAWALAPYSEALVIDASVPGQLGGTGVALDWDGLAADVAAWRLDHPMVRLVLAGGLRADNVQRAIALLSPDVVDVSSGVEAAPGIKDPERMQAFVQAVRG